MQNTGFVPPRPPKELQKKTENKSDVTAVDEKKVGEIVHNDLAEAGFSDEKNVTQQNSEELKSAAKEFEEEKTDEVKSEEIKSEEPKNVKKNDFGAAILQENEKVVGQKPPKMPTPPPRFKPVQQKAEAQKIATEKTQTEEIEHKFSQEPMKEPLREPTKNDLQETKIREKEISKKDAFVEEKTEQKDIQNLKDAEIEQKNETFAAATAFDGTTATVFDSIGKKPKEEKLKIRSNAWNWTGVGVFSIAFVVCLIMLLS